MVRHEAELLLCSEMTQFRVVLSSPPSSAISINPGTASMRCSRVNMQDCARLHPV